MNNQAQAYPAKVFWTRPELDQILSVYGRMVRAGEWRDYALDGLSDRALFSIFRRSSEAPLYQIEKRPTLALRQGPYSILAVSGTILRRGRELGPLLRFFEKRRLHALA